MLDLPLVTSNRSVPFFSLRKSKISLQSWGWKPSPTNFEHTSFFCVISVPAVLSVGSGSNLLLNITSSIFIYWDKMSITASGFEHKIQCEQHMEGLQPVQAADWTTSQRLGIKNKERVLWNALRSPTDTITWWGNLLWEIISTAEKIWGYGLNMFWLRIKKPGFMSRPFWVVL